MLADASLSGAARSAAILLHPSASMNVEPAGDSTCHAADGGAVLVVDHDEAARGLVARALRPLMLRTVEATYGEEAIARVLAHPDCFDAIVLEVALAGPITSGFEIARRLKRASATASIPILFVSEQAFTEADIVRAADYGAVDILQKPLSPAVLAAKVRAAIGHMRLVRQLRAEVTFAERHALVDPLTGLFNRRHLELRVLEESAYSKRHREAFAVMMVDLDHFKSVNDTYGHDEGDRVLVAFSAAIRSVLRSEDVAFRYGGEEFVLLLRACEASRAVEVGRRLRAQLREQPHRFADGSSRPITFSGGTAAALASEGFAGDELITRADEALYKAKRGGRDRVEIWVRVTKSQELRSVPDPAPAIDPAAASTRELVRALREARVLIASEERWIPQGYAQDREGRWRPVGSDDATRFSVLGAIVRVSGGSRDITTSSRRALREAAPHLYMKLNSPREELTHDEALALLDLTIAYMQAQPSAFVADG
jgi:two-component system cell cycle response regulator